MSYKPDTNLYDETTQSLKENGKSWKDVKYISMGRDYSFSSDDGENKIFSIEIEDFITYSKNVLYDSGYGATEINTTLKIVGDDWWLERHEYDGAENWAYKEKPKEPKEKLNIAKELLNDSAYIIKNN